MNMHTPGPWVVRKSKFDGLCVHAPTIEAESGCTYIIARDVNGDETPQPTYGTPEANAHLIAAAPELLDAMRGLLRKVECGTALPCELCDAARAAIAKATGAQP